MSFLASRKGRLSLVGSAVFVSSLMASSVFAATNGQVSKTSSQGSSDITVNVPKMVRVTGFQDITVTDDQVVNAVVNSTDITAASDACVGGNGNFTYGVTAASGNADGTTHRLASGTNFVAYTVTWGGTNAPSGTQLTAQTLDQQNLGNACSVADKIGITIDDANLLVANHGTYTDTLTVTVVPE